MDDIKNPPIKSNVSVLKIDSLTKEQLKDAEFTVYNDVDKEVSSPMVLTPFML